MQSTGVSGRFACGFWTDLYFADAEEQPVEQTEERETLRLQDQIHLRIIVRIIIILGKVRGNDAFRSYSM